MPSQTRCDSTLTNRLAHSTSEHNSSRVKSPSEDNESYLLRTGYTLRLKSTRQASSRPDQNKQAPS
jgi:hypothetical protein